jgi:hypothetical protein
MRSRKLKHIEQHSETASPEQVPAFQQSTPTARPQHQGIHPQDHAPVNHGVHCYDHLSQHIKLEKLLQRKKAPLQILEEETPSQLAFYPEFSHRSKGLAMRYLEISNEPLKERLDREISLTVAKMTENRHALPDTKIEEGASGFCCSEFVRSESDFWSSVQVGRAIFQKVCGVKEFYSSKALADEQEEIT